MLEPLEDQVLDVFWVEAGGEAELVVIPEASDVCLAPQLLKL